MASEDDNKDNLAEVNNQNDNNTETTDPAASSDAKGENSEDKSTTVDKDEGEKEVKLYVGNLPDQCRRAALQELFEKFGKVSQCDIVKNFAFVVSVIRKEQVAFKNVSYTELYALRACNEGHVQTLYSHGSFINIYIPIPALGKAPF